jgi:putative endopeptidase
VVEQRFRKAKVPGSNPGGGSNRDRVSCQRPDLGVCVVGSTQILGYNACIMHDPIDPKKFDQSVKPTDDFFRFVNQKWIDENPIPAEESRWGSFSVLRVDVENQLKEIFESLDVASDSDITARARKVRDFFRTGMDVAKRDEQGDAPLTELFKSVDEAQDLSALSRTLGVLHRHGIGAWWSPFAEVDAKRSDQVALYFDQAGLDLPDRDYYLKDDEKSREIREKYVRYMEAMLAGSSGAFGGKAPLTGVLMDIETKLAGASMTRVERRDIEKQYNKFSKEELAKRAPAIDWNAYFAGIGASAPADVIVCQPDFLELVNRFFTELPLGTQKAYLRWHVLNDFSYCLDVARETARFDFYGRTFSGAAEMRPLWRRVQSVVGTMLNEAVAELYVKKYFDESAKKKISDLVDHLTAAYARRIERLDWMSERTKQKALQKLAGVTRKLGYPDTWKDIEHLEVGTDSYALNIMRAYRFEFDRKMKQVGGPVDRSEWFMSPQTVNACYEPLRNEILFPAAILQSPFFNPAADPAVNFGGIGSVIGHELTHGFDDQGALFDEKGNMANWWTEEDKKRFDAQTERLVKQYEKFEALPGLFVNGKLTLGENIADLGGLLIAYDGLMLALKENPQNATPTDGFSPEQRFFIGYAVTERGAYREESLRSLTQIDPHAPSPCRVNGPLSNMQEFYDAFHVAPGDKLWRDPEDRVNIW